MFDLGWSELLVIAVVAVVVVGPKDLPRMLRTVGKTVANLKRMAGDFQRQFNDALREAELEDVRKSMQEIGKIDPLADVKKNLAPANKIGNEIQRELEKPVAKPDPRPAEDKPGAAKVTESGPAEAKPAEQVALGVAAPNGQAPAAAGAAAAKMDAPKDAGEPARGVSPSDEPAPGRADRPRAAAGGGAP